jgi:uncharacterized membrane protein
LLMIFLGLATLAVRNKPNPFVGIRFGYTYLSEVAWRKANTFAGLYCLILGFCLLVINLSIDFEISPTIYLVSIIPMVYLSYRIAKETYEKEDLATPIEEAKPMDILGLKRVLILEIVPILFYLIAVAILWNRIPETVAIHFDVGGKADTYASKPIGVILIPLVVMFTILALTILVRREPLLLRFPTAPTFLIILQVFLAIVFFTVLLYNADLISGGSVILVCMVGVILILALRLSEYI